MKGQWFGGYTGSHSGFVLVNIDECPDYFQGTAYVSPEAAPLIRHVVFFRTQDKSANFQFHSSRAMTVEASTDLVATPDFLKAHYSEDLTVFSNVNAAGIWDSTGLHLSWTTDKGNAGHGNLTLITGGGSPSVLLSAQQDWATFRRDLGQWPPEKFLFRGHEQPWRLRTSFHRAGRTDVHRFMVEDIPALHRHLSASTRHVFNLSNYDENGAFYNLIQHHGYPTPLLDWTYSPYVAAFFAYRGLSSADASAAEEDSRVRIFWFDKQQWLADFVQTLRIASSGAHVSIAQFAGIENRRMIPQQSISMVTNVDDIENFISNQEKSKGKQYLGAIDLPVRERSRVVRELSLMGITAGALFPGLDGACEEMKMRHFDL